MTKEVHHTRPPLRNLQIVTFSEVSGFIDCPAKWFIGYQFGVKPPPPTPFPLTWGSMFHEMRETLAGRPDIDDTRAIEICADIIQAWVSRWDAESQDAINDPMNPYSEMSYQNDLEKVDELISAAQWAAMQYRQVHVNDPLQPLLVEHPFIVRMRDRRGRPMPHLAYAGVIDGLSMDAFGQLVLDECKTTGERSLSTFQMRLDGDLQTPGYLAALKWLTGVKADQVLYDVIRRGRPSPPKIVGKGTEKQPFRYSKSASTTTFDLAHMTILQHQTENPGKSYDVQDIAEYESNLSGPDSWMGRFRYTPASHQYEQWRSTMVAVARSMRTMIRDPEAIWCNRMACSFVRTCAYKRMCTTGTLADMTREQFLDAGYVDAQLHEEVEGHRHAMLVEPEMVDHWRATGRTVETWTNIQTGAVPQDSQSSEDESNAPF